MARRKNYFHRSPQRGRFSTEKLNFFCVQTRRSISRAAAFYTLHFLSPAVFKCRQEEFCLSRRPFALPGGCYKSKKSLGDYLLACPGGGKKIRKEIDFPRPAFIRGVFLFAKMSETSVGTIKHFRFFLLPFLVRSCLCGQTEEHSWAQTP